MQAAGRRVEFIALLLLKALTGPALRCFLVLQGGGHQRASQPSSQRAPKGCVMKIWLDRRSPFVKVLLNLAPHKFIRPLTHTNEHIYSLKQMDMSLPLRNSLPIIFKLELGLVRSGSF